MDEKDVVLKKVYWNIIDICIFFDCGRNKASQIRQKAIKQYNGFEPTLPQKVKKISVLKAMNIQI